MVRDMQDGQGYREGGSGTMKIQESKSKKLFKDLLAVYQVAGYSPKYIYHKGRLEGFIESLEAFLGEEDAALLIDKWTAEVEKEKEG